MTTADLRRTPLFDVHVEASGKLVPFAGWEMPVQYSGLMEEHRAVRTAAGLFDVSHMGEVAVRGAGAEAFLQHLTPNDVGRLKEGRAHYSALLDEDGKYIDDLLVYRLREDQFILVVNAANTATDLEWIEDYAPDGVEVEDVSEEYALLALQGPRAVETLQALTETELAPIRYYGFRRGSVTGHPALLSRTGYTGEDGFELYLAPEAATEVWAALLDTGRGAGVIPAGLGARDTLRLEAGMALYGHELDRDTTPWEAQLGWTIKMGKGDFVGSRALAEAKERGPSALVVGFEITARGIAREGCVAYAAGTEIGKVTSGTFSPTLGKALGMAKLAVGHTALGYEFEIEVRGRRLPARVVEVPFYRRTKNA